MHECHESEYSKFLKSLGIDKKQMLASMWSKIPESEKPSKAEWFEIRIKAYKTMLDLNLDKQCIVVEVKE